MQNLFFSRMKSVGKVIFLCFYFRYLPITENITNTTTCSPLRVIIEKQTLSTKYFLSYIKSHTNIIEKIYFYFLHLPEFVKVLSPRPVDVSTSAWASAPTATTSAHAHAHTANNRRTHISTLQSRNAPRLAIAHHKLTSVKVYIKKNTNLCALENILT